MTLKDNRIKAALPVLLVFHGLAFGSAPSQASGSWNQAELYVIAQVEKGEMADLGTRSDGERELSAKFIQELLTNPLKHFRVHPHGIMIKGASMRERVDLKNTEIPYDVQLTACHFDQGADLSQSHFLAGLSLDESVFTASLDASCASVAYDFTANGSRFCGEDPAYLICLKVGGNFSIKGATFESRPDFTRSHIIGDLDCTDGGFDSGADFDGIEVDGSASFYHRNFGGSASFPRSRIAKDFDARAETFNGPVEFTAMKVNGQAIFDLSSFSDLTRVVFTGLTFNSIVARKRSDAGQDDKDGPPGRALEMIEQAGYSADIYDNLESFYRQRGRTSEADDTYFEHKARERAGLPLQQRVLSFLLRYLVGYGREPWLALVWGVAFVALGCGIFRSTKVMMTKRPEDWERYKDLYNPFWYSLALFLPFVNLEDSSVWAPRLDRRAARIYVRLHVIIGYLLVPIGLASWTGIIK
jgi:hypothetical protein